MSEHGGKTTTVTTAFRCLFRDKFWLSFALQFPFVFWSTDVHTAGYTALPFHGSKFIPARSLGNKIVLVYGGNGSYDEGHGRDCDRKPGMMTDSSVLGNHSRF